MKLYIEINDSKLIIAQLKQRFNKYYLIKKEEFSLNNLELFNNKIFNISTIYLFLIKYLKKNKIKKINTIISLPILKNNESCNELIILQIALLINKLNLKIEKIIGENILRKDKKMPYKFFFAKKELKNQLNFFKRLQVPKKKSIKSWIFLTLFLIISYILFFYQTQNIKKAELKKLVIKNNKLKNSLTDLNSQIKRVNQLKIINENIQKKITKLEKYKNITNNPLELLINISKRITTNCKLTKINTNIKKKENIKKDFYAILEGKALVQDEINDFLSKLKQSPKLSKAKIINIHKSKLETKKDEYIFKISCKIKQT